MTFVESEMPVVHRRYIAADMPKKRDLTDAPVKQYCICRSSRADGFMICCDNCNEWFHGECIDLAEDIGLRYDVYFCDKCQLRNPRLKCTYKSQSASLPCVLPAPLKKIAPVSSVPKTPKSSAIAKQLPPRARKKSVCDLGSDKKTKKEMPLQNKSKSMSPEKLPNERSQDTQKPEAVGTGKMEPKATRTAKTFESKASQCNLICDRKKPLASPSSPSKCGTKRRICSTCTCDEMARPDSRYCSDECGSVTTLTRIFAIMPRLIPAWELNCDAAKSKLLVQALSRSKAKSVPETDPKNKNVSEKSAQPAELQKENQTEVRKPVEDIYRKSQSKNPETPSKKSETSNQSQHSPAKKAKVRLEDTSTDSKRTRRKSTYIPPSEKIENLPEKHEKDRRRSRSQSPDKIPSNPPKIVSQASRQSKDKRSNTPCASPKRSKVIVEQRPTYNSNTLSDTSKTKIQNQTNKVSQEKISQNHSNIPNQETKRSATPKIPPKSNAETAKHKKPIEQVKKCCDKSLEKNSIRFKPTDGSCNELKVISQIVSKLSPGQKAYLARRAKNQRKAKEKQRRATPKISINSQGAAKANNVKN